MPVLCVGSSKGGVGKSTIAVNLAVVAANQKQSVLLVDTDPQGSSICFRTLRGGGDIQAISHPEPTLHKKASTYASKFDLVIIDAGGREDAVFRSAISASDLFLLPVLPGQFDLWGATDSIDAFLEIKKIRPSLEGRLLVNQVDPVTRVTNKSMEALRKLEKDIPLIKYGIGRRVIFKTSIEQGKGVIETEPNSKAAIEIRYLYKETHKILNRGAHR